MRHICAMLLLLVTVSGCDTQEASERIAMAPLAQSNGEGSKNQKETSRLWLDEEAAQMIKVMSGYSDAEDKMCVIRWEHGDLRGWAKLDSGDGSKPLSYDLGPPSDLANNPNVEDVSGWLVVAMRKLSDTEGEAYDIRIEEQFTTRKKNESQIRGFDSRRGTLMRVPPDADRENWKSRELANFGDDHVELKKWQDGESVSWLELTLGTTTSEPQANAEQSDERKR